MQQAESNGQALMLALATSAESEDFESLESFVLWLKLVVALVIGYQLRKAVEKVSIWLKFDENKLLNKVGKSKEVQTDVERPSQEPAYVAPPATYTAWITIYVARGEGGDKYHCTPCCAGLNRARTKRYDPCLRCVA